MTNPCTRVALIVEDDRSARKAMRELFRRRGIETIAAGTVADALLKLNAEKGDAEKGDAEKGRTQKRGEAPIAV